MVERRRLGRTDLFVPAICLGTMTWGEQNTEAEGHDQLDFALDRGINFLDTAEMYSIPPRAETQGSTERIIGNWLAARRNRDKIIIASKVAGGGSNQYLRPGMGHCSLDRHNITFAVEQSLKRLKTDYIDLYQLHWPDRPVALFGSDNNVFINRKVTSRREVPIEETLEVLGDLVTEGKIRHIGLSNETAWGTSRFLQAAATGYGPRVVSIQNAYNLLNRVFEIELAETAMREEVGLLAYSPLAQGFLTGKYLDGARPPGARLTLFDRGQRYQKPGVDDAVRDYVVLAREVGVSPAQLALAFVTSRCFVTSNIIGATTVAQLKANIESLDITITPELEGRINAIFAVRGSPAP